MVRTKLNLTLLLANIALANSAPVFPDGEAGGTEALWIFVAWLEAWLGLW